MNRPKFALLALTTLLMWNPISAGASLPITADSKALAERQAEADRHRAPITPRVSPGSAALWSAAATLVPIGAGAALALNHHETAGVIVASSGLVLGPSAGYFAAGIAGRGMRGLLLRTAFSSLGAGMVASAASDHSFDSIGAGVAGLAAGVGVTSILAIVDCALVAREVDRAAHPSVSLAPAMNRDGDAQVALRVKF